MEVRITLDTNTLISAIIAPKGKPARLLLQCKRGFHDLVLSEAILQETERVLNYARIRKKYRVTDQKRQRVIRFLRLTAEIVTPTETIDEIKTDPSDNRILECAMTGKVDCIVSGDKGHVLSLQEFRGIPILSVAEFLKKIPYET